MSEPSKNHIQRFAASFTPVMHLFHNLAGKVSRAGEFSLAQYRLAMLLYHEGPMTIKELQSKLDIAQSSTSELVNRMAKQKYLRKVTDSHDHRRIRISLTAQTRKQLEQRMAATREMYKQILEPLSHSEREELVKALEKLSTLLQKSQNSNKLQCEKTENMG